MNYCFYSLIICLFISCGKNAFDQFQKGDIEGAYKTLYKKAKKDKLKRDERDLFKGVISEVILEDSISFFRYVSVDDITNDMKAYHLFNQMEKRDQEIKSLKQRFPKYGFLKRATFDELSDKITSVLFEDASYLLANSIDTGNKSSAREAYDIFYAMEDYHTHGEYPLQQKKLEAERLGTEFVLIRMESNTFGNDWEIERSMDFRELRLSNGNWRVYHDREENVQYDMLIEVVVEDVRFFDEVDSDTRSYSESIITGYNTQTDTSGTVTETPIYDNVSAILYTDRIRRSLEVSGEIEVRTLEGSRFDENIRTYYYEDAEQYRYSGDSRAIPSSIRRELDAPALFSDEREYYEKAVERFMDEAGDIIEDIRR